MWAWSRLPRQAAATSVPLHLAPRSGRRRIGALEARPKNVAGALFASGAGNPASDAGLHPAPPTVGLPRRRRRAHRTAPLRPPGLRPPPPSPRPADRGDLHDRPAQRRSLPDWHRQRHDRRRGVRDVGRRPKRDRRPFRGVLRRPLPRPQVPVPLPPRRLLQLRQPLHAPPPLSAAPPAVLVRRQSQARAGLGHELSRRRPPCQARARPAPGIFLRGSLPPFVRHSPRLRRHPAR